MKIAYFVENYGQTSETFITAVLNGLSINGVQGNIYVDKIDDIEKRPPENFELIECKYLSTFLKPLIYLDIFLRLFKVKINIQRLKNKIAYKILYNRVKKYNPDVAYIDFGNNAIPIRKVFVDLNIPFIVHFHGKDASQFLANEVYLMEINKVFRDAYQVIVASNHIKRRLVLAGCSEDKIELIKYGISIDNIPPPNWEEKTKLAPILIFIGRFVEKKNPLALLYAFKIVKEKIPSVKMIMVGNGPLLNTCKKLIQSWEYHDAIEIKGALQQHEVFSLFAKASIYVQHSVTSSKGDQEGFAISLTEAAGAGLPVVSTIHNGITENVVDGETGYLIPEFDYEEMAKKVIYLIENPKVGQQMGANGRSRVEMNFKPEKRIHQIIELLNRAKESVQ